jgi:hypothetical protein
VPWFNVDDGFCSHPKALATSLSARGLWVTAGSWCSAHLTDGVVPSHVLASLGGTPELADELVAAGLWKRRRGAFVFHEWSPRNPTRVEVEAMRAKKAEAGRKGGLASANARSKRQAPATPRASPVVEPQSLSSYRAKDAGARVANGAATPAKPKPPWCGQCDQATRLTNGDQPMRCLNCHPLVERY